MTLLHMEGFEDLAGVNIAQLYLANGTVYTTVNGVPPRNGSYHAHQNRWTRFLAPAEEHATIIQGCAFWAASGYLFDLMGFSSDSNATNHVWITRESNGQISAYRGKSFGGTLLGTSTMATPWPSSSWRHVEAKVVLSDTVGSVVVKLDEVTILSLTGIDTKAGGTKTVIDSVSIMPDQNNGNNVHADDWYICNGAGSVNNDFLGDCIVECLYPSGNGNSSVLVGSDGNSTNNYLLVDETSLDTSDWVGSATSGDKDTYAFADLAHASATVFGIQTRTVAAKTDAGAKNFRAVIRSGGADYGGADTSLSTSYAIYPEIRETDPATAAAWTVSGVNNTEIGFEVR